MIRKLRALLISLILLTVLAAGLILLRTLAKRESASASNAIVDSEVLSNFTVENLRSLRIQRGGEEIHAYSIDGKQWMLADTPEFFRPVSEKIATSVRALANLSSSNIIRDVVQDSELADFGLDVAEATLIFRDSDGQSTTIEIGRKSPSGTGRYARMANSPTVVLLPNRNADYAFKNASDYRDMSMPTINPESISRMEFRYNGRTTRIEPRTEEDPYVTRASPYNISSSAWKGTYTLDDHALRTLLTEESPLPVGIKEYRDDLDSNDPSLGLHGESSDMLFVEDTEGNILSLIFGNNDGKGNRFVRYENVADAVFLLEELELLETEPFQLLNKFVFLGSIHQVSQVVIENDTDVWIMNRAERGNSEDIHDDYFEINNVEIPYEDFTNIYQKFIGIMWEGQIVTPVKPGNPELKITVSNIQPDIKPKIIRYWPYDGVYYQVSLDERPLEFLVGRYQVNQFIDSLTAKQKSINPNSPR